MESYDITNLIIDEEAYDQEHVTVELTTNGRQYIVTFQKSDLELMNAWLLENGASLPANLSEQLIDSIREDIKKKI